MDAKTIEQMLANHNRVLSLIYQAMDRDADRVKDYYAEELKLEQRSKNRDRY